MKVFIEESGYLIVTEDKVKVSAARHSKIVKVPFELITVLYPFRNVRFPLEKGQDEMIVFYREVVGRVLK